MHGCFQSKKTRKKNWKSLVFGVFLFFLSSVALATDTLIIQNYFYRIDPSINLIIVNQENIQTNKKKIRPTNGIFLDQYYRFSETLKEINTGIQYITTAPNGVNYTLYFSRLPLVSIDTPHEIIDEPRVYAEFFMTEPNGNVTYSDMGVEIRGGWSQSYPKKSLRIEFLDNQTGAITKDLSLLGMRSDDDWNLQALYNEPLRIRSKTSNQLWKMIHTLYYSKSEPGAVNGIQMEYVELFLNGRYNGIYALSERVDRKQLQLKKTTITFRGELYKGTNWGVTTLKSLTGFNNTDSYWKGFEFKYPEEFIDWINLYGFVEFIVNEEDSYFFSNYPAIFEKQNAVDYFIFLNLIRATDNTGKNIYIARYDYDEPYFYVPWDLDGVLGTMWRGERDLAFSDVLSNGMYDRLMQDCRNKGFYELLKTKWYELRNNTITHQNIMKLLTDNHKELLSNGVYEREAIAWEGFQPNETGLNYISQWLSNRLSFLDNEFDKACVPPEGFPFDNPGDRIKIYPNPASSLLNVSIKGGALPFEMRIVNQLGQTIHTEEIRTKEHSIAIPAVPDGLYFILIDNTAFREVQKLVIN